MGVSGVSNCRSCLYLGNWILNWISNSELTIVLLTLFCVFWKVHEGRPNSDKKYYFWWQIQCVHPIWKRTFSPEHINWKGNFHFCPFYIKMAAMAMLFLQMCMYVTQVLLLRPLWLGKEDLSWLYGKKFVGISM